MDRAEGAGLGVAVIGHVALFGLLSVGFLATPNPMKLESTPLDVSLVDEIALRSAAPSAVEPPAQSLAPEKGAPEDAPPPSESVAVTEPSPPVPAPKAAPPPTPSEISRPQPPQPPRRRPDRTAGERPDAASNSNSRASGTDRNARAERPRGSRLGDDFLKGITDTPQKGVSQTPRAQAISATAVASIGDAIKRQVQPCADRIPIPGPGSNLIISKLRLQMRPDGSFAARPELRGQSGINAENQRYARRVAELAASAMTACAPYELPEALYEGGWKDIIINYKLPD